MVNERETALPRFSKSQQTSERFGANVGKCGAVASSSVTNGKRTRNVIAASNYTRAKGAERTSEEASVKAKANSKRPTFVHELGLYLYIAWSPGLLAAFPAISTSWWILLRASGRCRP